MVRAAKKAKQATNDTEEKIVHDNFLFTGANTLIHEIGHMFITYLSGGGEDGNTPTAMKPRADFDQSPNKGEAGRKLEALIFGGVIENWEDPDPGHEKREVCSQAVASVQGQSVGT